MLILLTNLDLTVCELSILSCMARFVLIEFLFAASCAL